MSILSVDGELDFAQDRSDLLLLGGGRIIRSIAADCKSTLVAVLWLAAFFLQSILLV
jgi:hypothetical protein